MTRIVYSIALFCMLSACQHSNDRISLSDTPQVFRVTTKTIGQIPDNNELRYSGTIEPSQTIALMFKGPGTVENVFVEEGDFVKKGQPLATTDKTTAQNLYNASVASYEQATDAYSRLKSVHEKGSLTDIKWVEMETKLKQAESQMLITRSNLEDCTLTAPDNGMIGRRNIEPGQSTVGISSPFTLVKIDKIMVKVSVPESEIGKISKGMQASFSVAALGDQLFTGNVSKVGIVAEWLSRTYDVKILAENPQHKIKPGMICDVRLSLSGERSVIVVPSKAVSMDSDGKSYVWLVNVQGKTASKVEVKLGRYNQAGIEVCSGLKTNDLVVVDGKEKLSENSSIIY
jgi:RND family efflux transporter MFP subunit